MMKRAGSISSTSWSIRARMARSCGPFFKSNGLLSDGQTVRIVIEEKEGAKVVAIPQSAVALDQTGPYAFVVATDNKVEQRRLRLGAAREGLVAVEDGIKEGDRVVVQGQQRVRAGMTVAPETLPTHPLKRRPDRPACSHELPPRYPASTNPGDLIVISSAFIRRPRLALVISIVISIAGIIALSVIPVAQFPDIVPPQVQVTATYPGASAAAVEASVGQIVEGQVNGVERMIYMKSTSGGDGSYVLNVSFEVGVGCRHRHGQCHQPGQPLARLASARGAAHRRFGPQAISSLLQVVAIYSPKGTRDALFLSNYATVNILDTLRRVPASAKPASSATRNIQCASGWGSTEWRASASPSRTSSKPCSRRMCRRRSAGSARRR